MCGCWSVAAIWISRRKRSDLTLEARSGGSTFTTEGHLTGYEDARHPTPELLLEQEGCRRRPVAVCSGYWLSGSPAEENCLEGTSGSDVGYPYERHCDSAPARSSSPSLR